MLEDQRNEIVVYQSEDGKIKLNINLQDQNVWLTLNQIAELFDCTDKNVIQHVQNIYKDSELIPEATGKKILLVRNEGDREVQRNIDHYNLDMIISVGYRVNSIVATRFRQWATQTLKEYMIKGFAINDEYLKNPKGWDYFDELLERIREIRSSEKRFYQKVRDLFALSADYNDDIKASNDFFAAVQNKLLYAVTDYTAPELIVHRSDANSPNMNLTNWSGTRVRKQDVIIAKNYLQKDEIKKLDRLVTMFLDYAQDQAERRRQIKMADWKGKIDGFLTFNDYKILNGGGRIRRDKANEIAHEKYEIFNNTRKKQEAIEADKQDLKELEDIETTIKKAKKIEIKKNRDSK